MTPDKSSSITQNATAHETWLSLSRPARNWAVLNETGGTRGLGTLGSKFRPACSQLRCSTTLGPQPLQTLSLSHLTGGIEHYETHMRQSPALRNVLLKQIPPQIKIILKIARLNRCLPERCEEILKGCRHELFEYIQGKTTARKTFVRVPQNGLLFMRCRRTIGIPFLIFMERPEYWTYTLFNMTFRAEEYDSRERDIFIIPPTRFQVGRITAIRNYQTNSMWRISDKKRYNIKPRSFSFFWPPSVILGSQYCFLGKCHRCYKGVLRHNKCIKNEIVSKAEPVYHLLRFTGQLFATPALGSTIFYISRRYKIVSFIWTLWIWMTCRSYSRSWNLQLPGN